MGKVFTLLVALSATGLGAYGISQQHEPEPATQSQAAITVAPSAPKPAPAQPPTANQIAPAPRATLLQGGGQMVNFGTIAVPYNLRLTITAVSDPAYNFLVGVQIPLRQGGGAAYCGGLQLPQGGMVFGFDMKVEPGALVGGLPYVHVSAGPGPGWLDPATGQYVPEKWIFGGTDCRLASSAAPFQISGRFQGVNRSFAPFNVDYTIQP